MTNREIIIGRIREALKIAAPHPALEEGAAVPPPASPQKWLPPVSPALEQQVELFRKNAEDLKAEFCEYTLTGASEHVKKLATAGRWKKIGTHAGELTDAVASGLGLPIVRTDVGYAVNELESCDAGLTECEVLIAQTGSVMVSAPSAGGRALSVLPPHHIVLARRSQVVPDLSAALQHVQEKYQGKFPSFLSFISGPSRTGDIERILVLGAHGPKKLTILLLP